MAGSSADSAEVRQSWANVKWAIGGPRRRPPMLSSLLLQIKPVEVHHLGPGCDEVLHELLLRIRGGIDLRQGPKLRVRAEDEIDARARPPHRTGLAVAAF